MTKLNNMKQKAGLYQTCKGDSDPYIVWSIPTEQVLADVAKVMAPKMLAVEILLCIIIDLLLMVIWWKRRILFAIPKEIVENRKLIISLAKNDFKAKFAGSYFGIIWAFVQPVVTIVVYWFVFDKALNSGTQITKEGIEAPFALWLTAGMVPWFYFSEVLSAGSNALVEYNYLVKKVVFKISALPFVKVLSSIFVHVFFVVFMIILSACYGFTVCIYITGNLLLICDDVFVYWYCICHQCNDCIFPRFNTVDQYSFAGFDVDDSDHVEYGCYAE